MWRMLAACLCLSACSTPQTVTPSPGNSLEAAGAKQDKVDARVAAAVVVASEANTAGKPAVVNSELKVASAYLPPPSEADVAFARQRASKADPSQYAKEIEYGKKLNADLEKMWVKLEAEKKENAVVIAKLKTDIEQAKKDSVTNLFTAAALFCFGVALVMTLAGQYARAAISAAFGLTLAGVPMLLDSKWFIECLSASILVIIIATVWQLKHEKAKKAE
jgi:hypothetical protein